MSDSSSLQEIAVILAKAKNADFIRSFLTQLLTKNETEEVVQRWAIVKMLRQHIPQREIAKKLHTSLCKITRGSRELKKKDSVFVKVLGRS